VPDVGGGRAPVLVTGAAGTIGSILYEALADEFAVLGLDAVRGPGVDHVADMTKPRTSSSVAPSSSRSVAVQSSASRVLVS
jgi:nucleoside-diphosphate-sugar epimerase